MGKKRVDHTGKKYGRLTAVEFAYVYNQKTYWKFQCDCGAETITRIPDILKGKTTSCGCYHKEKAREKRIDHTGKKFGRLTAIEYVYTDKERKAYWKFQCDCGAEMITQINTVTRGDTTSCGCYRKENAKERGLKHGDGIKGNKWYLLNRVFHSMKQRCENPNNEEFHSYGGKGITVCPEWHNYEVFKKWALENGYEDGLTIDRKNNEKGYSPDNCQWLTRSDNSKKQRLDKIYREESMDSFATECLILAELKRKSKGGYLRLSEQVRHQENCPVCQAIAAEQKLKEKGE